MHNGVHRLAPVHGRAIAPGSLGRGPFQIVKEQRLGLLDCGAGTTLAWSSRLFKGATFVVQAS